MALKRSSSSASRSSNSITCGSKNTFAAVRKSTPCFFRLACSLAPSHSKSIASPGFEHTDIQYPFQGMAEWEQQRTKGHWRLLQRALAQSGAPPPIRNLSKPIRLGLSEIGRAHV